MTARLTLAATSLFALGIASANAQDTDFADQCVDLFAFVEDSASLNLDDEPEIVAIIERNDARACQLRLNRLERSATADDAPAMRLRRAQERRADRDGDAEREDGLLDDAERGVRAVRSEAQPITTERSVTEQVQVQETVTVRGDVDVVAPLPNVSVRPEPAQVQVRGEQPRVTVRQTEHSIVVRERPATITIGMPTITIEQEAPEIVITMPDPSVDVAMAEPTVEVRQAAPRVTVAVPEPRVDLNLTAGVGEGGEPVRTRIRRERGEAAPQQGLRQVDSADANVFVGEVEPNVQVTGLDGEADITFESQEPTVRYEGAEPEVRVTGEPEIRFERSGEPRIRFEQAASGQDRQRLAARRDRGDRPQRAVAATGASSGAATGAVITVGKLVGQEVLGANGEEIGSIERVIRMDGRTYAVVEHGGFLGLGDTDIPLPLTELRMDGDRLIATTMTEERAEQMQANDIERGEALPRGEAVRLGR